jgi:hypothetical protein
VVVGTGSGLISGEGTGLVAGERHELSIRTDISNAIMAEDFTALSYL